MIGFEDICVIETAVMNIIRKEANKKKVVVSFLCSFFFSPYFFFPFLLFFSNAFAFVFVVVFRLFCFSFSGYFYELSSYHDHN